MPLLEGGQPLGGDVRLEDVPQFHQPILQVVYQVVHPGQVGFSVAGQKVLWRWKKFLSVKNFEILRNI